LWGAGRRQIIGNTGGAHVTSDDNYRLTVVAIRTGDLETLRHLLAADPELASSTLGGVCGGRTPLHVVTDWPGYYPKGPAVARLLIDAGADVNARGRDGRGESPLHWAASSDDVDVAEVLVDAGADLEAPDGSIGTPLDNAIGYGCWNVARLLVQRGAKVDKLWHAAALGMIDRLAVLLAVSPGPENHNISQAFWHACKRGATSCRLKMRALAGAQSPMDISLVVRADTETRVSQQAPNQ
jgi:uncharacterized protein